MKLAIFLVVLTCLYQVQAFPTGAPSRACVALSPTPGHGGNAQNNPSNNVLDISSFMVNNTLSYTPGYSYNSKFLEAEITILIIVHN